MSGSAAWLNWPFKHYQVPAITLFPQLKAWRAVGVLLEGPITGEHCWQSDLVLEQPRCVNCFFLLHLLWPFKSGSGIAANHSANIFPNRNPMTQGNSSLILALLSILWGHKCGMITFSLKGDAMASLCYPCYGSILKHSDVTMTLKYRLSEDCLSCTVYTEQSRLLYIFHTLGRFHKYLVW